MTKSKTNDKMLIIIGFVIIGIIFILYSRITDISITEDSMQSIERVAVGFYLILLMSFGAIGIINQEKFLLLHHSHMAYFFH